ncbi:hypothetical protein [Pontibacterium sp.]|uniref:hypothetical protein n=1 Tax=Pontibacterium sp. TaxID=2036026 RepID=UPI003519419D
MEIVRTSGPLNDRARDEILFRGDLIVFSQIPALQALQGLLDRVVRQTLGDRFEDVDAHSSDFSARMAALLQRFNAMSQTRELFAHALAQSGMDVTRNFADKLFLRCVPPTEKSNAQFRGSIGYHRDTWGSNIQQQINWWTPLYPISANNTLVFYPEYWDAPVANTTAEWSFEAFREARRLARSQSADAQIGYPYAPEAKEAIDTHKGVPILIAPGDLLCFSSAHLHGSSPEPRSGYRFNLEMRSYCGSCREGDGQGVTPPENIDNAQSEPNYHWFKPLM